MLHNISITCPNIVDLRHANNVYSFHYGMHRVAMIGVTLSTYLGA